MPKFIEISCDNKEPFWALKIENKTDVFNFIEQCYAHKAGAGAKICLDRLTRFGQVTHVGANAEAIILGIKAETKGFHFMYSTAELIQQRWKQLNGYVDDGLCPIIINKAGGTCDLKSFLKINKATVCQEKQVNGYAFPENFDKTEIFDVVILENDAECSDEVYSEAKKHSKKIIILSSLQNQSEEKVIFYLTTSPTIVTKSTLINTSQVLKFISVFSKLKGKTIKLFADEGKLNELVVAHNFQEPYSLVKQNNKIYFL